MHTKTPVKTVCRVRQASVYFSIRLGRSVRHHR
nr:MAG TPA: hypothetical protein [Caudoviricetes sp.]